MKKFNRLVILDNLLLPNKVWAFLKEHAHTTKLYGDNPIHGLAADPSPPSVQGITDGDLALSDVCQVSSEYTSEQIQQLIERIGGADAVISCWTNLPDAVLSKTPNVKYVAFWTHAYSHRINPHFCEAKNIHVDHIPDYGSYAVTEYIFSALLSLNRNLSSMQRDTLRGSWAYEYLKTGKNKPNFNEIRATDLYGKSLGIVGLGRIGTRVAITASLGFGMNVSYYSRSRKREIEGLGIRYESLPDLVKNKDVVSLNLPPEIQEPIITRELLSTMREGTILVNTGGGNTLDEDATLDLAETGHLRLVLDVYRRTPPRQRLKRLSQDPGRHLFTYRAAWYTRDAIELKANILKEKVSEYLNGS